MALQNSEVGKAFYAGNYPAVLNATIYSEFRRYTSDLIPMVISSLAAIGQLRESELTLALKYEELSADQLAFIYYHLAVANINSGRFQPAAEYIVRASRLRSLFDDQTSNFFLFMALAYYRYAGGKARQGTNFAYRAGGFLNKNTGSYTLFLWLELMGNLGFLTGDTENASEYSADALRLAGELGRSGSVRALKISSSLQMSKHSRDSTGAVAQLERVYGELGPLDAFLKSSVCFELVRHNALINRNESAGKIYRQGLAHAGRFSSRRLDIVKLLRQVDIHLAELNYHFCLPILEMIDAHLLRNEDQVYLAETLDKLTHVYFYLSMNAQARKAEERLEVLVRRTGIYLLRHQRSQNAMVSSLSVTGSLNYREIAFLAEMQPGQSIDVHDYKLRFGVSEITACRDLSHLTTEKYLIRVGKARATKYIKPDDQYLEIVRSAHSSQPGHAGAPALQ